MSKQHKLIEDIKSAYLVEKNKVHSTIKSMWSQYQKMGKELSEGIYAEDNHFIYELIQNAEDTESKEDIHTIEFTLEDSGLIVYNNETGFEEEQIKAISAFGESTKSSDKNKGYIGEKGIGFKSVFKITDKPAIFSNGYRFYFRRFDENDVTEYIIPHWIDDIELKSYPEKVQNNKHTTLFLPFDQSKKADRLKSLRQDIRQIEPILLLFLNRLDSIKIYENNKQLINTTKSSKKNENIRVVSIKNNQQKDKYYTFKKTIDVDSALDEVSAKDGRRKDVKKREIILAFPDAKNETKEDRIFAFLPTNLRSRLGFIIQADFILQSGRENIAIDNDWNQWQLDEIRDFITDKIVYEFQKHSKLKLSYLNYFIRYGESDNHLINTMYEELIDVLHKQEIILGMDKKWYKPKNILLLPDDVKLDSIYLKELYGDNYEQIHPSFTLPDKLAQKFDIAYISKQDIIEKIADYFLHTHLNDLDEDIVYALTVFLSKYSSVDSRSREYDKRLFIRIKDVLPIIPKYLHDSKFYHAKNIYLSDTYEADFYLEDIVDDSSCDFKTFNFLSPRYYNSEQKGVENFLRKVLDELKEDNNKKTIEFMSKYPQYLQDYLLDKTDIHYKGVFDFLIDNQKDNLERISKIPLVLTDKKEFYSGKGDEKVYFPTSNVDKTLKILNHELHILSQENKEYREILQNIFKVREADIHNIILDQYLPWFKNNRAHRNEENDKKIIDYTSLIVKHFSEFDRDQRKKIKESLYFIGSNNSERYLSSGDIYLSQVISEAYFHTDSIEVFITDKSYFNFLDKKYDSIFEQCNNSEIEDFFGSFQFNKSSLVDNDLSVFLRFISSDLTLDENIQAFKIIIDSDEFNESKSKIEHLSAIKLFSHLNELLPANQLFIQKIDDLSLAYLNDRYHEEINFSLKPKVRQYFQNKNRIEPFIKYLSSCESIEEAIKIYIHLDYASNIIVTNRRDVVITPEKIKMAFEKKPLIFDTEKKKYYPSDVVWTQQQSANPLMALSDIYPEELQTFFIKKVRISQHRGIKQIVDQIKDTNDKTKEYYDLLVDLSQLVVSKEEIDDYRKAYDNNIDQKNYSNDVYQNAIIFLSKDEKIFINDMNQKMGADNIFLNDIGIDSPREQRKFILTLKYYGNDAFEGLIKRMSLHCLSHLPKQYKYSDVRKYGEINHYRQVLHFAYDVLFTKYYDQYIVLPEREEELRKINDIDSILLTSKIEATLTVNDEEISLNDEKYYINTDTNELVLVNEKYISKAIANTLGAISDKDLKDFIDEVIEGGMDKSEYYKEEELKEKQDFYLEISDNEKKQTKGMAEEVPDIEHPEPTSDVEDSEDTEEETTQLTPEEEQERLKGLTPEDQIEGYQRDGGDTDGTTEPVANGDLEAKKKSFLKNIKKKTDEIRKKRKAETKPRKKRKEKPKNDNPYRSGEEDTKEFFRRKDQYAGHCQICGFTFKIHNGPNYCERFTWTDRRKNQTVAEIIYPGNSLCLCGKCYSIINGGGDFKAAFLQEFKESEDLDQFIQNFQGKEIDTVPKIFEGHIDFDDMFALPIRLLKEDEYIYFTEDHLIEFFAFLNEDIEDLN